MRRLFALAVLILGGFAAAETPPPTPALPGPAAPPPPAVLSAPLVPTSVTVTRTKLGIPGDPVNLMLVGTRTEVTAAFRAAEWFPAAPITVRSGLGIAVSVAANVPYRRAPVSDLYLFGRAQDLAFEQAVGHSARSRHHVRLWCSELTAPGGRPVWVGVGTFDARVGRSATTGRLTHHIAADVDREREAVMTALWWTGRLTQSYLAPHVGPTVGRNGGGDPYFTDGNVAVGILRHGRRPAVDDAAPK